MKKATVDGAAALDRLRTESQKVVRKGRKRSNLTSTKFFDEEPEPETVKSDYFQFGNRVNKVNRRN